MIISGSIDKTVKFWSFDGNLLKKLEFEGAVLSIDITSAGNLMAVGLSTGQVVIYDLEHLKIITEYSQHTNMITALAF